MTFLKKESREPKGYNTDQFNILLVGNSKGEKIEQKKIFGENNSLIFSKSRMIDHKSKKLRNHQRE